MDMEDGDPSSYSPPLALEIVSVVFLALGVVCALIIAVDIIVRKGWRSMMPIMIPVYVINATYMLPVMMFLYFGYGRPGKPSTVVDNDRDKTGRCEFAGSHQRIEELEPRQRIADRESANCHTSLHHPENTTHVEQSLKGVESGAKALGCQTSPAVSATSGCCKKPTHTNVDVEKDARHQDSIDSGHSDTPLKFDDEQDSSQANVASKCCHGDVNGNGDAKVDSTSHCCHDDPRRPMWVTVLAGVSHCGAGCVLGDVVGEWVVWGSGATINGHSIWAELLVDYAFALLFGILFQYFSIAPMTGHHGPLTLWRAAKADVLSLTSFEVGAFGWMVAYQVGIWNYRLDMMTWTYWWMMAIGMVMGFAAALPMNVFLLKWNIKAPCC